MFSVKVFIFSPIQENTYLLYNDGGDCIIIDPGTYFPEEKNTLSSIHRIAFTSAGYVAQYPLSFGPCFWQ